MGEMATQIGKFALPEPIQGRFLAWIQGVAERQPLSTSETRKGVRALSARYVEGRIGPGVGGGALAGAGLRAAFATYYAPLHFLIAFAATVSLPAAFRSGLRRVVDLGTGTGAVGAASALAVGGVEVFALDRSAWALGEALRTFAALGVRGRTRRVQLPSGVPRLGPGDLVAAGFVLNECGPEARERLIGLLARALRAQARVLVLEPLARGIAPWWEDLAAELAPAGAGTTVMKWAIERPEWIERLDTAAGLDHREIGARVLWGPPEGGDGVDHAGARSTPP